MSCGPRVIVVSVQTDSARASLLAAVVASQGFEAALLTPGIEPGRFLRALLCWSAGAECDPDFGALAARIAHDRRIDVQLDYGPRGDSGRIDLSRWRGGESAAGLVQLRERLSLAARWEAGTVGTGFARSAIGAVRTWTRAVAATAARHRLVAIAGSLFLALGAVIGILSGAPEAGKQLCRVPLLRTHICSPHGWGDVATAAQDKEYRAALVGGCAALRKFVRGRSRHPRLEDARRHIDGATWLTSEKWHPDTRATAMFVAGPPQMQRALAASNTRKLADRHASEQCEAFPRSPDWRPGGVEALLEPLACESASDGWRCTVAGRALCRGMRRVVAAREVCA
jgi:hypothetical protein